MNDNKIIELYLKRDENAIIIIFLHNYIFLSNIITCILTFFGV